MAHYYYLSVPSPTNKFHFINVIIIAIHLSLLSNVTFALLHISILKNNNKNNHPSSRVTRWEKQSYLTPCSLPTTTTTTRHTTTRTVGTTTFLKNTAGFHEPENSQFGRQDYWDNVYKDQTSFSWYAGWEDLQPFIDELLQGDKTQKVLIPGVGNDATLVDMYKDGYSNLTAMDYAPEGIERCREMLGPNHYHIQDDEKPKQEQQQAKSNNDSNSGNGTAAGGGSVRLVVADARDLSNVFDKDEFHAVFEKGTLDAIYLSGGQDKDQATKNLQLAVSELGRCIQPGGIWISVAAVVVDQIQEIFDSLHDEWTCIVDKETLYFTNDGYASNNIDGNLLVWKKKKSK